MSGNGDERLRYAQRRRSSKLAERKQDLFDQMRNYGIDPKRPDCWFRLAVVLDDRLRRVKAEDRKAGRSSIWTAGLGDQLVTEVNAYLRANPGKSIGQAIKHVRNRNPEKFKGEISAIKTRYHESARLRREKDTKRKVRPIVEKILRRLDEDE
jgi:hypothetical protein